MYLVEHESSYTILPNKPSENHPLLCILKSDCQRVLKEADELTLSWPEWRGRIRNRGIQETPEHQRELLSWVIENVAVDGRGWLALPLCEHEWDADQVNLMVRYINEQWGQKMIIERYKYRYTELKKLVNEMKRWVQIKKDRNSYVHNAAMVKARAFARAAELYDNAKGDIVRARLAAGTNNKYIAEAFEDIELRQGIAMSEAIDKYPYE